MASPEPPFVVTPPARHRFRALVYLGILVVIALLIAAAAMHTDGSVRVVPETMPTGSSRTTTAVAGATVLAGADTTTLGVLPTTPAAAVAPPVVEAPSTVPPPSPPPPAIASPPPPAIALSRASSAPVVAPEVVVHVGDCVTTGDGAIERADCGSAAAGYRVIGKSDASGQYCPQDVDRVREHGGEFLCMDIDWVVGSCLVLPGGPRRIDCTAPDMAQGVRVLTILRGVADVNQCASGNRGVVYRQRQFVVCVAGR
ncbi:LppU/SCO3897 family protein [Nocardia colli]|uniref:LppU/SCO3897 family protein n=1 Tax=Nocardia colli TaxID=2545717 RepID=UPI0035DFA2F1